MSKESVTLLGDDGFSVTVLAYGASLCSIRVPTAKGTVDVLLSYADYAAYRNDRYYLGATVGRYANRIGGGCFMLSGVQYLLDRNEVVPGNCLHGGRGGLHSVTWCLHEDKAARKVECCYLSRHGDQGFPGELDLTVGYQIIDGQSLLIEFTASSDRESVLNLANHAYFNLNADGSTINNHEVRLHCDAYTPVNDAKIPTGCVADVAGSRFDLRHPMTIGSAVFDTNFVVAGEAGRLRPAAQVFSPESGITLDIATTQHGLQFYTGDYLDVPFRARAGFCFEAQNYPDAPNQPTFPSARIAPDRPYSERTIYRFN